MATSDVVVIGGGISGVTAAHDLARLGVKVTLVERGELASMASGWTLAGVRQSGRDKAEVPLARAAVRRWEHLSEELDADVEYRQEGNLRLARNADEVPRIETMVHEQQALGLDLRYLPDNDAVRAIAPALSGTVLAASFCPTDGHANPHKTVNAFARAAKREGAEIRTNTEVTSIDVVAGAVRGVQTTEGPIATDVVVVAAGVYSDRLLKPLGIELPITIAHAIIVQTVELPPVLSQVLGVANGDVAGRQEVSGRLRFTGAALPWPWDGPRHDPVALQPPAAEIAALIQRTTDVFPSFGRAGIERVWGGLLDMTPDDIPVIERSKAVAGLIVAAGFSGHGFCLGPVTGRILSELATSGSSTLPIEPFKIDRFGEEVSGATPSLHG